jgi:two-component system invasion response regulator UvrY
LKIEEHGLIYINFLRGIEPALQAEMNQIALLFVDKNPLIRKAWDFQIGQDRRFKMAATCESGEMAIELAAKLDLDIVIIDSNLRGMNGLETTRLIKKHFPGIKVIGLSFDIQVDTAHKMIRSGANGCLSKMSALGEIFRAIREVKMGRTYICKEMRALQPVDVVVDRIFTTNFSGNTMIAMNHSKQQANGEYSHYRI